MSSTGMVGELEQRAKISQKDRLVYHISRHWLAWINVVLGLYAGLPFLAPVLMRIGLTAPARVIYLIYSFLCHQLPERSFFLFGSKFTYTLPEVQAVWKNTLDVLVLRQFIGTPTMGWKVAWSDRMVAMFGGIFLFSLLWALLSRKRSEIPKLPWWGLVLFLLPVALDGGSHFISDLAGIEQGFRESNLWLAAFTQNVFPASFYAGNAWGSFNSIMRLLTGLIFAMGVVWFSWPYFKEVFEDEARSIEAKLYRFQRYGMK